jgi:hypothetical protein
MSDNVNHPAHYAEGWSNGAEVIDITEHLNFNRGNAVKYISRAGKKSALSEVEDLQKAQWYLSREIERLTDRSQAEPAYQVVSQDFWGGIDASIVEAQEKRERDRTQKPPRVWDSLCEVPHNVVAKDRSGDYWGYYGGSWGFGSSTGRMYWNPVDSGKHGVQAWDRFGPFTEVLDTEQKGSE